MRVWLLDVYKGTETYLRGLFEPYSTNLARLYKGEGFESIPIPQEFQLILTDFMNTFDNQNKERQDLIERVENARGIPQAKGVVYFNPANETLFWHAKHNLAPKIQEALESGVPVVVIAGKFIVNQSTIHDHNYNWLVDLDSNITIIDHRPAEGPASLTCVSSDRAVKELYEEFHADLTWEAAFKNHVKEERKRSLLELIFGGRKIEAPLLKPLFLNVKNDPVAFTLKVGKGELVVLPNINDVKTRSRYIAYILDEFLPQFRPRWFPDRWAGSYTPAVLMEKDAAIQTEKEELLQNIKEKEDRLESQKQVMITFIDLLTQADARLEEAVKRAFQVVFRSDVVDLDSVRDQGGKPRLFDLIVTVKGKRFAIEIKGGNRSLKKDMLDKTGENVKTYQRDYPGSSVNGTVIIINDQISKAPKDRGAFATHLIEDAENRGITILSTLVLMEIMAMYLAGDIKDSDLVIAFSKPGLAEVPKK